MLCGRFEFFGSYSGNREVIRARIGVTCGLDGWGSANRFVNPNKIGLLLVQIWALALPLWVIGISAFATPQIRYRKRYHGTKCGGHGLARGGLGVFAILLKLIPITSFS